MSESSGDVACPACDRQAQRAVTAPALALMPANNRIAHSRNEKSADQPELISKSSETEQTKPRQPHTHAHGSHCHGHGHQQSGMSHSHGRPWMIGH